MWGKGNGVGRVGEQSKQRWQPLINTGVLQPQYFDHARGRDISSSSETDKKGH